MVVAVWDRLDFEMNHLRATAEQNAEARGGPVATTQQDLLEGELDIRATLHENAGQLALGSLETEIDEQRRRSRKGQGGLKDLAEEGLAGSLEPGLADQVQACQGREQWRVVEVVGRIGRKNAETSGQKAVDNGEVVIDVDREVVSVLQQEHEETENTLEVLGSLATAGSLAEDKKLAIARRKLGVIQLRGRPVAVSGGRRILAGEVVRVDADEHAMDELSGRGVLDKRSDDASELVWSLDRSDKVQLATRDVMDALAHEAEVAKVLATTARVIMAERSDHAKDLVGHGSEVVTVHLDLDEFALYNDRTRSIGSRFVSGELLGENSLDLGR